MKRKLLSLLMALVAVCGVQKAYAYSTDELVNSGWTQLESSIADFDVKGKLFVFVDAGSSAYLMADPGDGGRAISKTLADPATDRHYTWLLEGSGSTYALKGADSHFYFNSGSAGWNNYMNVKNDNANYIFTLTDGKYSLKSATTSAFLGPWNNNAAAEFDGEGIAANKSETQAPGFYVFYKTIAEYAGKPSDDLLTSLKAATPEEPVDVTHLLTNFDFSQDITVGWNRQAPYTWYDNTGVDGTRFVEFCDWNAGSWNGAVSQTISGLPNGRYRVKAVGQASSSNVTVTLTANGVSDNLVCIGDQNGNVAVGGQVVAAGSGLAGWQYMEVECQVTDGTLYIIGNASSNAQYRWSNFDYVTIACLEVYDLSSYIALYEEALANAQSAANSDGKFETAVKTALTQTITTYSTVDETSQTALEEAIAALNTATSNLSASVEAYESAKAYLDRMALVLNNTNVYTEDAYNDYYGNYLSQYEANTLETATAATLNADVAYSTGWHSANNIDDILLSTWTIGGEQAKNYDKKLYINTWSTEGATDGSKMTTPFFEYWVADEEALTDTTLSATITGLTAGNYYEVSALVRVRQQNGQSKADNDITFTVGENTVNAADGTVTKDVFFYKTVSYVAQSTDGTLNLSFNVNEGNHISWLAFKNVNYEDLGNDPKPFYRQLLGELITTATNKDSECSGTIPSAYLPAMIADAQAVYDKNEATYQEYLEAKNTLQAVIDNIAAIQETYAIVSELIATCESYSANSTPNEESFKTAFDAAIATAETSLDAATSEDAMLDVESALETARQTYVLNAYPTNAITFDLTFKVTNPKFDNDKNGWSFTDAGTKGNGGGIATNQSGAITGKYYEVWGSGGQNGCIYQMVTSLPNGLYRMKAAAFRDQLVTNNIENVSVFANEVRTQVTAATPAYYTVDVNVINGALEIGIESIDDKAYRWMGIDNVSLELVRAITDVELAKMYLKAAIDKMTLLNKKAKDTELAETLTDANDLYNRNDATADDVVAMTEELETGLAGYEKTLQNGGFESSTESWAQVKDGENVYSGVAAYGTLTEVNSVTPPMSDIIGNNGNALGISAAWQGTMSFTQDITLPNGTYILTYDAYNSNGATQMNSNLSGVKVGETYYTSTTTSFATNAWTTDVVVFEVPEEMSVTVTVGYKQNNVGSGSAAKLWIDNVAIYQIPTDVTLTMTEAGWATLILPFAADVPAGLTAYTCSSVENDWLVLEEAASFEANKPYIVKSNVEVVEDKEYDFSGISTATETSYNVGYLTGVFADTPITSGYVLQNGTAGVGFYAVDINDPITVTPYRVYVPLLNNVASANLRFLLPGDETAVDATAAEDAIVDVYHIGGTLVKSGVKAADALNGLPKGIYVVDGKKVMK